MKKRLFLALFLSLFMYSRAAYAIFDIPAIVQAALEFKTEVENKIKEIEKLKDDIEKRVKQGFALASNCFKSLSSKSISGCDIKGMKDFYDDAKNLKEGVITRIKEFPVMPAADKLKEDMNNMKQQMADTYQNLVRKAYIFKKGGKDLERLRENRNNLNAIITDEVSMLFAKAATTRHSIQTEESGDKENETYKTEFKQNNLDEILAAQNSVGILTNSRLARIVELRAFMNSAPATSEMMQHSVEANDKDSEEE